MRSLTQAMTYMRIHSNSHAPSEAAAKPSMHHQKRSIFTALPASQFSSTSSINTM